MRSLVWRKFRPILVSSVAMCSLAGAYVLDAPAWAQLVLGLMAVLGYLVTALFQRRVNIAQAERAASVQRVAAARERAVARALESRGPAPVGTLVAGLDMAERRRRYTEGKAAAAALYALQKANLGAQKLAAAETAAQEVEPAIFTLSSAIPDTAIPDDTFATATLDAECAISDGGVKPTQVPSEIPAVDGLSSPPLVASCDVEPLGINPGDGPQHNVPPMVEVAVPSASQEQDLDTQELSPAPAETGPAKADGARAAQPQLTAEFAAAEIPLGEASLPGVTPASVAEALVGESAQRNPPLPETLSIAGGINPFSRRGVVIVQSPQQTSAAFATKISNTSAKSSIAENLAKSAPVTIGELVRYALQTGTVLQVAYGYGSRPGEQRPLVVVAMAGDDTSFRAFEPPGDERKTYITHRVLWASDDQGRKASNFPLLEQHTQYMAKQKQLALATQAALTGYPSSLPGCKFEITSGARRRGWKPGVFYIVVKDEFNIASVHALGQHGAEQVCCALHLMHEWYESKLWDVLGGILKAQFYWVEWLRYQTALEKEGRMLISAGGEHWDARYVGSKLRPLDEENERDIYMQRRRLFETKDLHLDKMFELAMRVDAVALSAYLTDAKGESSKHSLRHANLTPEVFSELTRVGLIVLAAQVMPMDELLGRLKVAEIKALLNERGIVLKGAKRPTLMAKLAELMDPALEAHLRETPALAEQYVFSAPPGMSWDDLQNFRTCYVVMLRSLMRWLTGEISGAAAARLY